MASPSRPRRRRRRRSSSPSCSSPTLRATRGVYTALGLNHAEARITLDGTGFVDTRGYGGRPFAQVQLLGYSLVEKSLIPEGIDIIAKALPDARVEHSG